MGQAIAGLGGGIDGEALATDETGFHAPLHDALEHGAQNIAVTEPAMAVDREGRMIGNTILSTKPTLGALKTFSIWVIITHQNLSSVPNYFYESTSD